MKNQVREMAGIEGEQISLVLISGILLLMSCNIQTHERLLTQTIPHHRAW